MKKVVDHLLHTRVGLRIAVLAMAALSLPASGWAVTGVCSDCHVMHAYSSGADQTPNDFLTDQSCLACHTTVGDNTGTDTPYVYLPTANTSLAGGNFKHIDSGDAKGHNTSELSNPDSVFAGVDPPGWKSSGFDANTAIGNGSADWSTNSLSCSGVYGCHGKHDGNDLQGAHHGNSSGLLTSPTTVGASYRFLHGVKGGEDDDWQFETAVDKNLYYGEARSGAEATADRVSDTGTMSYFCAECHGKFHAGSGNEGIADTSDTFFTSPWIRHPVDVSMPTSGEYSGYNAYNVNIPVATSSLADTTIDVSQAADRIVTCLSCHVAHASAYDDALRFDYSTMDAGGGASSSGCFACHTTKDI